jgi:hypothetical protein
MAKRKATAKQAREAKALRERGRQSMLSELAAAEEVSVVEPADPFENVERIVSSYAIEWDYLEPSETGEECARGWERWRRDPGKRCITLQLEWVSPSNRRGVYGPYWYAYARRSSRADPQQLIPTLISVYVGKGRAADGKPSADQLRAMVSKLEARGAFDLSPLPKEQRARKRAAAAKRAKRAKRHGF